MKNFIKQICQQFSILTVLTISVAIITACNSSTNESSRSNDKAATGSGQNKTAAENKQAEARETPKTVQTKQSDDLPSFKKGEDYRSLRTKMLQANWKPFRSEDNDNCPGGGSFCEEFPELESGPASGQGQCVFRWKSGEKVVLIFTADDPPFDTGYEFEKPVKSVTAAESWNTFWTKFSTAVNGKDKDTLLQMMSPDFDDGGGGGTPAQWLQSMDSNNSWVWYKKVIVKGTKANKCEIPCRSTKDGYLLFEYRKGKWLWTGLGGEGGDGKNE